MPGLPELASALVGYLLGAIPSGVIVGRLRGVDPRMGGSGRIGAANALRTLGPAEAALVLAMDVGKGVAAVLAARLLAEPLGGSPEWAGAAAGVAAVIGHVRSIFIGFGGGRGVATGAAGLAVMAPLALLAALFVFALVLSLTRYVSLGSILAALTAAGASGLLVVAGWTGPAAFGFAASVALVVILAHADNIARLLAGTERRLGQKEAGSGDA